MRAPSRRTLAVVTTTLLATLFAAGTVAVPWLERRADRGYSWARLLYRPVCHQRVERSLTVFDRPQAVCARCSGLYVGGLAGMLVAWGWLRRRTRPAAIWVPILMAPTLVDAILPWVGLPQLGETARWFVALPAGGVAGLFLAIGAAEIFPERKTVGLTPCPMENGNG